MKVSLIVISSKEKEQEAGVFITKLVHRTNVETVFGTKAAKQTFYVRGTIGFDVDQVVEVDMDLFRVEEHTTTFADKDSGEMITRDLKWLHLKSSLKIA